MSLVFGLAAPEPVLVLISGERLAVELYRTAAAHLASGGLATLASLRAFGGRREEQMRQALAGSVAHPVFFAWLVHADDVG